EREGVPPVLTIVGSTLFANGPARYSAARAIAANAPIQARIADTVLDASESGSINAADIEASGGGTWTVTHTAYTTVFGSGPPLAGSATNASITPIFAGQPAGDYQLTSADAPLLGAGDPSQVIPGETDLAGQPRVLSASCDGAPDIGAYELARASSCPSPLQGVVNQGAERTEAATQAPPGSASAPLGRKPHARPAISGLKVRKGRHGPTLEFRLSEPARITVTISKAIDHRAGMRGGRSEVTVAKFTEDANIGGSAIPLA